MRSTWAVILIALMFSTLMLMEGADATSVSISLEDDEFTISVDPTDPEQGSLEVEGSVQVTVTNLLETVTVGLSVNISELKGGEPTGRYWLAVVTYGSGAIGQSTKVFKRNDAPAAFTVTIGPELYDPNTDTDIPVPPGLGLDVEGQMVVTAEYSGAIEGKRTSSARITPGSYHLVNLSTPDNDLELEAGDLMNRTLRVKNAGNNVEDIVIEADLVDELQSRGWNATISSSGKDGVEPGEELISIIHIKAPRKIEQDEVLTLFMGAYTKGTDTQSGEPLSSSELSVKLYLRRSSLPGPDDGDDDTDDDDDKDERTDPWMAMLVVGLVIVVIVILVIILFKKGRGGDGDERDPHSSMVRI
ncbi:MAG: hypothetical protein MUC62_09075 [Candidatus Thermoplasmatota archaeon]|jgi:hypothetical protein|nr:hypothetical protein [Candidatus Thermoplasmatota archaeon]